MYCPANPNQVINMSFFTTTTITVAILALAMIAHVKHYDYGCKWEGEHCAQIDPPARNYVMRAIDSEEHAGPQSIAKE
jgi:hypothetical protein